MTSIIDNKLDYPYTELIITNDRDICQTWELALEDSDFKNRYDEFSEESKNLINDNLSSRKCLTVDNENVPKCYTTNRKFEICGNLTKEIPNNLNVEMTDINNQISKVKKEMMDEIVTFVEDKREKLNNLIDSYVSKETMVSMNKGYNNLVDDSIDENKEKKSQFVDAIEEVENLKNSASENMTYKRKNFTWYQNKNNIIKTFMWWFLLILLFIVTLYLMSLPLSVKT